MIFATLAAVTFIHQNNQIRTFVVAFRQLGGACKLVDDGKDNALGAFADTLGQVAT